MAEGLKDHATGTDEERGMVTVTLPAGFEPSSATLRELLKDPRVDVTETVDPIYVPQDVRGGAWLLDATIPGETCTSGFSVEDASGKGGILTAAHCVVSRYFKPEPGSTPQELWMHPEGYHYGEWGDVQWFSTDETEQPSFYTGQYSYRPVYSVQPNAEIFDGETVALWSRKQYTLFVDTIYDDTHTCGPSSRMAVTEAKFTKGGDSGAPWFLAYEAVGIHNGICNVDGAYRSYFTKAGRVDEALGVHIRIHP